MDQPINESPGQQLRTARESKRFSVAEVADRLNLSQQQINALENDDYQCAIALVYIRGYLRLYARLVGLPEQQILSAFAKLGILEPEKPEKSMQLQLDYEHHRHGFNRRWLPWLNGFIALILLVLVLFWLGEKNSTKNIPLSIHTTSVTTPVDDNDTATDTTTDTKPQS